MKPDKRPTRRGAAIRRIAARLGSIAAPAVIAASLMAASLGAGAQTEQSPRMDDEPQAREHSHIPLDVDALLGWAELIDATVAVHPLRFELAARSEEVAAWQARGRNWLAGQPSLYFSELSDSALDDRGQRELETGIELPLWRGGQRRAVRDVASSTQTQSTAAGRALRWEIAGRLRETLWDIAAADDALESAEASLAVAAELVRVVERLNAAGDLAQTDVLLARSARLAADIAVVEAEALVLDAERGYRSLTGLDRRPAQFDEALSEQQSYTDEHPLLALVAAEIAQSRANVDLVERSTRGNPVLTVGPRRQRDPLSDYYNDSLGVSFKLPVGGQRHGTVERARAARAVAEAQTRRAGLERGIDLELHEVEHTLSVIEESLAFAEQHDALAAQQWTLGRTAFEAGEIELRDLLRIQDAALNAARELRRLRIERSRTIAALNQALGELP